MALFGAGSGNPTGPERLTAATGALLDVDFSGGDSGGAGSDVLMVLGAGTDRALRLWDATTGRIVTTLTGHAEKVVSAKFCPWNYARAVSCSHDRTIKVWDLERGFCKASIMREQLQLSNIWRKRGSGYQWSLRRRREDLGSQAKARGRV